MIASFVRGDSRPAIKADAEFDDVEQLFQAVSNKVIGRIVVKELADLGLNIPSLIEFLDWLADVPCILESEEIGVIGGRVEKAMRVLWSMEKTVKSREQKMKIEQYKREGRLYHRPKGIWQKAPPEVREKVVADYKQCGNISKVARDNDLSRQTVYTILHDAQVIDGKRSS